MIGKLLNDMCLIIKDIRISKEPVTCFKVTTLDNDGNRKALYQPYSYPKELKGIVITDTAPIVSYSHLVKESGYFHMYENYGDAFFVSNILKEYDEGKCFYEIWECEIPENEIYFVGIGNDVCSKRLKFINRITIIQK